MRAEQDGTRCCWGVPASRGQAWGCGTGTRMGELQPPVLWRLASKLDLGLQPYIYPVPEIWSCFSSYSWFGGGGSFCFDSLYDFPPPHNFAQQYCLQKPVMNQYGFNLLMGVS